MLINGIETRLKTLVEETCEHMEVNLIEIHIKPDQVHLVIAVAPRLGIHRAVKKIKAVSSRVLREEFSWLKSRIPSLWTHSYFVSTSNKPPLPEIQEYVFHQKAV